VTSRFPDGSGVGCDFATISLATQRVMWTPDCAQSNVHSEVGLAWMRSDSELKPTQVVLGLDLLSSRGEMHCER
jgi:hypothetical protein